MLTDRILYRECLAWLAYCRAHYSDRYVQDMLEMWRADHRPAVRRAARA